MRESIVESGATKTPDVASLATRHDNLMYAPCRTLPRPTGSNMMRIAASTDNAGAAGASTRGAGAGFGCQCGAIVDEVASLICCSAPASGSSSVAMQIMQILLLGIDATFLIVVNSCYSVVFKLVGHRFGPMHRPAGLLHHHPVGFAYTRPEASAVLETRP